MPVAVCGEQLQRLSLLEEEKQRVAQLRKMQLESEQFRYFEDQLRRQEQANRKQDAGPKEPEPTDGSCLSQAPKNHTRLDPNRNKHATPLPKPAATLAAVQSESQKESALCPHLAVHVINVCAISACVCVYLSRSASGRPEACSNSSRPDIQVPAAG